MPRADQATIDLLTDYFQAMEVKDFDRLGAYYADDITQTFANAPTITGRTRATMTDRVKVSCQDLPPDGSQFPDCQVFNLGSAALREELDPLAVWIREDLVGDGDPSSPLEDLDG